MRKFQFIIITVLIFFLYGCSNNINQNSINTGNEKYLPYLSEAKSQSNVRIDCKIDADCEIKEQLFGCFEKISINKITSETAWDKYNQDGREFFTLIEVQCEDTSNKMYVPVCRNKICTLVST